MHTGQNIQIKSEIIESEIKKPSQLCTHNCVK